MAEIDDLSFETDEVTAAESDTDSIFESLKSDTTVLRLLVLQMRHDGFVRIVTTGGCTVRTYSLRILKSLASLLR
jgi:hypothetical protein